MTDGFVLEAFSLQLKYVAAEDKLNTFQPLCPQKSTNPISADHIEVIFAWRVGDSGYEYCSLHR